MLAEFDQDGKRLGWVALSARPNSIPFLSDDRRLLQSLARTLGVVLENVRFRQQRLEQEEREQQLRWLASRAELRALRAQINPHFLFNALNAIAGLIPVQPQLADETVQQLAEVFRYTLRKSEKEWVRLDEEVEFVTAYLQVERARFGDRLQTEFSVDPAAGAIPVPTMTVQPLIENAIKHGVSAQEGRGRVRLCATIQDQRLRVEVFDNGPGFPAGFSLADSGAATGHGLRNVIERLTGYYGDSAQLRWERGDAGTRVWLTIPLVAGGAANPGRRRLSAGEDDLSSPGATADPPGSDRERVFPDGENASKERPQACEANGSACPTSELAHPLPAELPALVSIPLAGGREGA
jgi:LytS/YehU family sensor histidine kinase